MLRSVQECLCLCEAGDTGILPLAWFRIRTDPGIGLVFGVLGFITLVPVILHGLRPRQTVSRRVNRVDSQSISRDWSVHQSLLLSVFVE